MAQAYPSRPIRIVVPTPAGAPPDILARIVGTTIAEAEGWTVVVENKPGGAMTIGAADALRQPADGYTLFSVTAPIAAAQALVPSAKLHVETDFVPVIQLGKTYNVLVVSQSTPAQFAVRIHRLPQTRSRQAHVLVGRLRYARASARRVVQARNRRADDARALQGQSAGDRATSSTAPTRISSSPPSRWSIWSTAASCGRW